MGATAVALVAVVALPGAGAGPAAHPRVAGPPGTGAVRPRVAYDPGTEPALQARLGREPYRTVFISADSRAHTYLHDTLGDDSIVAQRNLSRAAKMLSFEYALDRTVDAGTIVPFASGAARIAAGDRVRDLLVAMYDRSRLAVDPPLGGIDRDINTSEEIINYATAFDTMQGAGYDFGASRATVVTRLHAVAAELYRNFVDPASAQGAAMLLQNNHLTKSASAIAIAAVVLAGDIDPTEARTWWDWGVSNVDDMLRYVMNPGDGGYGEGPWYFRYSMQNVIPFVGVWERFLGTHAWTTTSGLTVPAYAHSAEFAAAQRWMLDTTAPDGSMAPIDDTNVGRSYYFGALPASVPASTRSVAYWRWANAPQPFETDGSVDLADDTIVNYDDTIAPTVPTWTSHAYLESGDAVLRSGWDNQALELVVLGEHDTASEFGRDRTGVGRAPESHEHADPGSFSLYAGGQPLALDPGYLDFTRHGLVNEANDHNVVLVDGNGPDNLLVASIKWLSNPLGRPPTDGQSTLHSALDTDGVDSAAVTTRYGLTPTTITRRFDMLNNRFVVVTDDAATADGTAHDLTWQLHGNGGGTSGGTFSANSSGGTWTNAGERLATGIASTAGPVSFSVRDDEHEAPGGVQLTHATLDATVHAAAARTVEVLVPIAESSAAPAIVDRSRPGLAVLTATTGDQRLDAYVATSGATIADSVPGLSSVATDGTSLNVVRNAAGNIVALDALDATSVSVGGVVVATTATRGRIAWTVEPGSFELHAEGEAPRVATSLLGVAATAADGACSLTYRGGYAIPAMLEGNRTVRFHGIGNSAPAADAGADRRVARGAAVVIPGRACDLDGSALHWQWQITSAPPGSARVLTGATSRAPTLRADRTGAYRLQLVVTDASGAASEPSTVLVVAGARGADTLDNDLDGLIDSDDADGDGADPGDSAVLLVDGAHPVARGATVPADRLTMRWQGGDGPLSAPARLTGTVVLGARSLVAVNLSRAAGRFAGTVTVQALGLGRVTLAGAKWAVDRVGDRMVLLRATSGTRHIALLLADTPRTTVGPS